MATNLKNKIETNLEFSEGYALSKIIRTNEGRDCIEFHIIDESKNDVASVASIDSVLYNLVKHFQPTVDNVFDKVEELKKSAKLGKFANGIAKIEIDAELAADLQTSSQSVVNSYYITRSGLLLGVVKEVGGKLQNKKGLKSLKLAQEIWNNPNKFRKLRAHSGFEESSLISKIVDKNILDVNVVKALFDVAQHSLDENLKQAEKALKAGTLSEQKFNAIKTKILSNADKNQQHLLKHERRADIADREITLLNGWEG